MAIPKHNELKGILGHFNLGKLCYTFTPLHIGYINDTYLISLEGSSKYILQRINQGVFEDVNGLMNNVGLTLDHLNSEAYHKVELVRTTSGKTYWSDASGSWRILTYIENSTTFNTTTFPKIAFEAGKIIGTFHTLIASVAIDEYVDTIPNFHSLELRERQFHQALTKAASAKKKMAGEAIGFAKNMLSQLKEMTPLQLPIRICHNDTKLNNILFSKNTQKALCLIDLDTLMKGYFHYDFGDAIRTIVNTAPEDEQDHSKITFDEKLFHAFVKGLASNAPFLSAEELKALPYGALLMPFLQGIRALTDYLNNNIYYKVAYENQNLDRCLSLFDFTQKAFDNIKFMSETVAYNLKGVEYNRN